MIEQFRSIINLTKGNKVMFELIKLLTPWQFMFVLQNTTPDELCVLDHLGPDSGHFNVLEPFDIYEWISSDDKLRLRIMKDDVDYSYAYALKPLREKLVENVPHDLIMRALRKLFVDVLYREYEVEQQHHLVLPEIKENVVKPGMFNLENLISIFKLHHRARKEGLTAPDVFDIFKVQEDYYRDVPWKYQNDVDFTPCLYKDHWIQFYTYNENADTKLAIYDEIEECMHYRGVEYANIYISALAGCLFETM